jgi:hypothetical protein
LAVQIAPLKTLYRFGMKWPLQSAMTLRRGDIVGMPVVPVIVQQAVRDSVARVLPLL